MEALVLVALSVVSALLSSSVAGTKGWSSIRWFLAGFFFGPFGLIAAVGLPDRRVRTFLRHLATEKGWTEENEKTN